MLYKEQMTYNCDITKQEDKFVVRFPDVPNAITFGKSEEDALYMAYPPTVLAWHPEYNK